MAAVLAALPALGGTGAATAVGTTLSGGAIAAAGGSVAGAAAAASAGAAAAGGISLTSVLTGVTGVVGALSSIGQGIAASNTAKEQAAQLKAQAAQELEAGAERARQTAKEARAVQGAQNVAYLANGLDIGTGTPVNVRDATAAENERRLSITRRNAGVRAQQLRLRSRGLLSEARGALARGFVGGALKAFDTASVLA